MHPIERAIKHFGSQASMAAALGVAQPTISEWLRCERQVPDGRCPDIERLTGGAVICDDARPDVPWSRIPDKAWPWHPKGRPVIDVTKAVA